MAPTPPIVLCMIPCDSVHTDPVSSKRYLLGTLTSLRVSSRNEVPEPAWLYAELTNGHGSTRVEVRLVHPAQDSIEGKLVVSAEFILPFTEPREVLFLTLRFDGSLFRRPVEHRVILASGGVDLLERRLEVLPPTSAGET